MKTNVLYFGDNLEILRNREYFPDSSIDLIYPRDFAQMLEFREWNRHKKPGRFRQREIGNPWDQISLTGFCLCKRIS